MPIISKNKKGKTVREWSNVESEDEGDISLGVGLVAGSFGFLFGSVTTSMGYTTGQGFANAISLGYTLTRYYFGNTANIKPAAVVAGIPFGSIEELSHGISDREVKYRANGGVFLAHQTGGNESLRIVGKAWGPNRFVFLQMLDLLFLYGSETMIDAFKIATTVASGLTPIAIDSTFSTIPGAVTIDPWQVIEENNLDEGFKEYHMTFPIITKNRVYLHMFIETYSWRQEIDENGRKSVTYTLFFRKYEPTNDYEFAKALIPAKKEGEDATELIIYKQHEAKDKSRWVTNLFKSTAELAATILIGAASGLWEASDIFDFGGQMIRNWFGVDVERKRLKGRIPGIIERGFF